MKKINLIQLLEYKYIGKVREKMTNMCVIIDNKII